MSASRCCGRTAGINVNRVVTLLKQAAGLTLSRASGRRPARDRGLRPPRAIVARVAGPVSKQAVRAWLFCLMILPSPLFCLQAQTLNTNVVPLYTAGEGGYYFRIPSLAACADGTLLAFAEGRPPGTPDFGNIDIVLKRSTNSGASWGPLQVVGNYSNIVNDGLDLTVQNPTTVLDKSTGRVFLLAETENTNEIGIDAGYGSRRVWITDTGDDGQTWSVWREISSSVKPDGWRWFVTGPGHGIQLENGTHAGRLVVPIDYTTPLTTNTLLFSAGCIYSDDHGTNWQLGAVDGYTNSTCYANETCVVELSATTNGQSVLYYNTRKNAGAAAGNRGYSYSVNDGAALASPFAATMNFIVPVCEGSLLRFSHPDANNSGGRILFACPNNPVARNWLSIWVSRDEGVTWEAPRRVWEGPSAYSDMTLTSGGNAVGILFESTYGNLLFRSYGATWLDAPPSPADTPNQGLWTFMESSPGQTTVSNKTAILDYSPAGYGLNLMVDGNFTYLTGPTNFSTSTAISFNGTGGLWLSGAASGIPFDFYANDSFTVETMVRIPTNVTFGALVAKDFGSHLPSWWLRVQDGGCVRFLISDSKGIEESIRSAQAINDGAWHKIAAVRDANARQLLLYVDGVLSAQGADNTIGSLANGRALTIGRFSESSSANLIGDIDYVQITPAALMSATFLSWPLPLVVPVARDAIIQRFVEGGVRVSTTDLLSNDTDPAGHSLTITGVSSNSAAGGTVSLANGWVYYAPQPGSTNGDTFTYTVSNGNGGAATGTVVVRVKPDDLWPPNLALLHAGDRSFQLSFSGIPGRTYEIQYTEDLNQPNWQTLTNQTTDLFGVSTFVDRPSTNATARFYRLSW